MHLKLSSQTKQVIADLIMSQDEVITVTYAPVQWQSGGSDCGLFALAFATSICAGHDPATILYDQATILYDQAHMHSHLLACLLAGEITPFPQRTVGRRTRLQRAHVEQVPVFCLCRLPDDGATMVQCDDCDTWFHKALPADLNTCSVWYCNSCHTKL